MSLRSCAPAFCFYFGASGFCFSEAQGSPHIRMRIGREGGVPAAFPSVCAAKRVKICILGGLRRLFRRDEGVNSGSPPWEHLLHEQQHQQHPASSSLPLILLPAGGRGPVRTAVPTESRKERFSKGSRGVSEMRYSCCSGPASPPRPERGACLCERGSRIWRSLNVAEGMGVYSNK